MTLLLADFCKLRVSASETRKPGKPFSRAYLPEPHPVKSNLRGEERRSPAVPPGQFAVLPSHLRFAPVRCPSGTVRSASISPPLRSGSMSLRDSPQCFHLTSASLRFDGRRSPYGNLHKNMQGDASIPLHIFMQIPALLSAMPSLYTPSAIRLLLLLLLFLLLWPRLPGIGLFSCLRRRICSQHLFRSFFRL